MKFRLKVKQERGGLLAVYYPQFRWFGLWCYYDKTKDETVLPYLGFFFRADAERFLHRRYNAWIAKGKSTIIPWNPYK